MSFITVDQLKTLELKSRKMLGVDFGEVRVGLAISDALGIIASPLRTISRFKNQRSQRDGPDPFMQMVIDEIVGIVERERVVCVVVGFPLNMNGSVGAQAQKVEGFAQKLEERLVVPILLADERWSSKAAERSLQETLTYTKRQKVLDRVAAAFVLQGVIDSIYESRDAHY
jgi:putative Holliday junction resolvase